MLLLDKTFICKSRSDQFFLYALGDLHIGARHCAENHIRRLVDHIAKTPNAYWIGGGDLLDCVKPQDVKRWDVTILPDWMFEGTATQIKNKLKDILQQQAERLFKILEPIKHKCIGLLEGNHEYAIRQHYNEDIQAMLCNYFDVENLTDSTFIRLKFKRLTADKTIVLFACHGHGGGRTAGSEPNQLAKLMVDKRAHIIMRGHSHSFHIMPPVVELFVPTKGELPTELLSFEKYAGNWGCWLRSWVVGDSTYDSRACYPAKPMATLECVITPHKATSDDLPEITMRQFHP